MAPANDFLSPGMATAALKSKGSRDTLKGMKSFRIFSLFLILAGMLPGGVRSESDVPDPFLIEQENLLRREAEKKIQEEILNRILGEGRATALVNVEITVESQRRDSSTSEGKVDDRKGLGDQDYLLPWVPAPKNVAKSNEVPKDAKMESASGEVASATVRQTVTRFDVTVIHDDSVSKEQLTLVEDTIRSAYSRFQNILKVIFKPTRFARYEVSAKIKEGAWDFLKPQYLLPGIIALLLMLFLFGPLMQFLRSLLRVMNTQKSGQYQTETLLKNEDKDKGKEGEGKKGEGGEDGELTEEEALELKKAQEEAMAKFVPFAYIDETNLTRFIYLMSREPPDVVATVISYLKPEFVKQTLLALPSQHQAKVAVHMAAVKQMTEAEIRAFDAEIKQKVDFLVGGLHSLLKVLDDVDHKTRDNILEYLKNERPHLYDKVRKCILMFDDLAGFPDEAMQVILRELRAESLARALKEASPELKEKFFKNMSQGAVSLIKEEMEYSRSLTQGQIEEEREKALTIVKRLEAEGRIKVREKADEFLDLEDMDIISNFSMGKRSTPASAPVADPGKAQAFVEAGINSYNAQNYSDALVNFQQAVQLDPSSAEIRQYLGNCYYALSQPQEALTAFEQALTLSPQNDDLRRWVEEFRATLVTGHA